VFWAKNALTDELEGRADLLDLRTLNPLDWDAIERGALKHGKVLVVTEEPVPNSFAEALAGRIGRKFFQQLDAPVQVVGSRNVPGIPVNAALEQLYLPGVAGVRQALSELLAY